MFCPDGFMSNHVRHTIKGLGYLGMCIRHRCYDYANRKHGDAKHLHLAISLSPEEANQHGGYTSTATQDNMNRD